MNKITRDNFITEVYDRYYKDIYKFIVVRVYFRKSLAQDLTQEIFLKIWEKRSLYDAAKSNVRTWIYQVARNHLIDFFRKRRITNATEGEKEDVDTSILESAEDEIMVHTVLKELKNLTEYEQAIIQLRYVQDLAIDEVAIVVGKEYGTVKVALHRAIKKLITLVNGGC